MLDPKLYLQPIERELVVLLHKFPKKLQEAAEAYSLAIIAQYAFELAKTYNRFYTEVPILHEEAVALKALRVYLSATVAYMLQHSMRLLGIEVPTRM